MNLVVKTYQQLVWQARLSREVLSRTGSHTILGTAALVLSQYAQLFALFLPLKVLILLSSERVPHALEPLISSDNKMKWVIAFFVAILVLYLASIALVTWSNRQYTRACSLLQSGRQLGRDTRRRLHTCYFRLWQANSEALVALVGGAILGFLSPTLLAALVALLIVELMAASYFIKQTSGFAGRIGRKLREDYATVLQFSTAVNFLLLFGCLILLFYLSSALHLVSAVLIIFIARKCLQSLSRFTKWAALLAKRDDDAEALLLGLGVVRQHVDVQEQDEELTIGP